MVRGHDRKRSQPISRDVTPKVETLLSYQRETSGLDSSFRSPGDGAEAESTDSLQGNNSFTGFDHVKSTPLHTHKMFAGSRTGSNPNKNPQNQGTIQNSNNSVDDTSSPSFNGSNATLVNVSNISTTRTLTPKHFHQSEDYCNSGMMSSSKPSKMTSSRSKMVSSNLSMMSSDLSLGTYTMSNSDAMTSNMSLDTNILMSTNSLNTNFMTSSGSLTNKMLSNTTLNASNIMTSNDSIFGPKSADKISSSSHDSMSEMVTPQPNESEYLQPNPIFSKLEILVNKGVTPPMVYTDALTTPPTHKDAISPVIYKSTISSDCDSLSLRKRNLSDAESVESTASSIFERLLSIADKNSISSFYPPGSEHNVEEHGFNVENYDFENTAFWHTIYAQADATELCKNEKIIQPPPRHKHRRQNNMRRSTLTLNNKWNSNCSLNTIETARRSSSPEQLYNIFYHMRSTPKHLEMTNKVYYNNLAKKRLKCDEIFKALQSLPSGRSEVMTRFDIKSSGSKLIVTHIEDRESLDTISSLSTDTVYTENMNCVDFRSILQSEKHAPNEIKMDLISVRNTAVVDQSGAEVKSKHATSCHLQFRSKIAQRKYLVRTSFTKRFPFFTVSPLTISRCRDYETGYGMSLMIEEAVTDEEGSCIRLSPDRFLKFTQLKSSKIVSKKAWMSKLSVNVGKVDYQKQTTTFDDTQVKTTLDLPRLPQDSGISSVASGDCWIGFTADSNAINTPDSGRHSLETVQNVSVIDESTITASSQTVDSDEESFIVNCMPSIKLRSYISSENKDANMDCMSKGPRLTTQVDKSDTSNAIASPEQNLGHVAKPCVLNHSIETSAFTSTRSNPEQNLPRSTPRIIPRLLAGLGTRGHKPARRVQNFNDYISTPLLGILFNQVKIVRKYDGSLMLAELMNFCYHLGQLFKSKNDADDDINGSDAIDYAINEANLDVVDEIVNNINTVVDPDKLIDKNPACDLYMEFKSEDINCWEDLTEDFIETASGDDTDDTRVESPFATEDDLGGLHLIRKSSQIKPSSQDCENTEDFSSTGLTSRNVSLECLTELLEDTRRYPVVKDKKTLLSVPKSLIETCQKLRSGILTPTTFSTPNFDGTVSTSDHDSITRQEGDLTATSNSWALLKVRSPAPLAENDTSDSWSSLQELNLPTNPNISQSTEYLFSSSSEGLSMPVSRSPDQVRAKRRSSSVGKLSVHKGQNFFSHSLQNVIQVSNNKQLVLDIKILNYSAFIFLLKNVNKL